MFAGWLFLDVSIEAHGIPEEDRATWDDFVVIGGEAGVVDVGLGEAHVGFFGVHPVGPIVAEPLFVQLAGLLGEWAFWFSFFEGGFDGVVEAGCEFFEVLVLLLGHVSYFFVGLVDGFISVFFSDFFSISGFVVVDEFLFEAFEFFVVVHGGVPFDGGDGFFYDLNECLDLFFLYREVGEVFPEGFFLVEVGVT